MIFKCISSNGEGYRLVKFLSKILKNLTDEASSQHKPAQGIADLMDLRTLFLISSYVLLLAGLVVLVLPGLGQPAAQWKRTFNLLRGVEAAPRLGVGRTGTRSEIDRFILHLLDLAETTPKERQQLTSQTLIAEAPG
jgi:hypothetical protein